MRPFLKPILLFILSCHFIPIFATTTDSQIQAAILHFMAKDGISGAAVLLYKNGALHRYYLGEANPAKHIPVSGNTIFEVGSITKTFTALLLAQRVLDHKINLHDPVAESLDLKTSYPFRKVTFFELASYTAALPFNAPGLHYNAALSTQNNRIFTRFLRKCKMSYAPGSKALYSNLGFGILGRALENEEDEPLPDLMQQSILGPLGMHNSGLDLNSSDTDNLAQGFTATGKLIKTHPSGLLAGAWAMKASAQDMEIYLKTALLLPDPTLSPKLLAAMKLAQSSYYSYTAASKETAEMGLAWKIVPLDNLENVQALIDRPQHPGAPIPRPIQKFSLPQFRTHALISKTGATDGFRAYIAVIPETQTGIVVLINRFTESSSNLTNLANRILLDQLPA